MTFFVPKSEIIRLFLEKVSAPATRENVSKLSRDLLLHTIKFMGGELLADVLDDFPKEDCTNIIRQMTEERRKFTFLHLGMKTRIEILLSMDAEPQVETLLDVGERMRLEILKSMDDSSHTKVMKNIEDNEEERWYCGLPDTGIITIGFPYDCIVCHKSYSEGQTYFSADCSKYSFHRKCDQANGLCPEPSCQRSAEHRFTLRQEAKKKLGVQSPGTKALVIARENRKLTSNITQG
jgi:hypothetical protein